MKIILTLIISIAHLSVFSYECRCFELDEYKRSPPTKTLYLSLCDCISSLPEIEGLHGIGFKRDVTGSLEYGAVENFYWHNYFKYISTKDVFVLFSTLRNDFEKELNDRLERRKKELADFSSGKLYCYWTNDAGEKMCIPSVQKRIQNIELARASGAEIIKESEKVFYKWLEQTIAFCRPRHNNPLAFYESGCLHFLKGNNLEAIEEGILFIKKASQQMEMSLIAETYLREGQAYGEMLKYDDAIISLTQAINLDPKNKQAYFERAGAYFEIGDFDLSLRDYLASGVKPQAIPMSAVEMLAFSTGLTQGILNGGSQGAIEYIPSLLSSLQGLGHGLWALVQDPVPISKELVQSIQSCVNFIRESTPQEALVTIVPELRELFEEWDQIGSGRKGEIIGYVIGKYGVDIFAATGVIKGMKLYRDLKQANNLLTFEAMAISERNKTLIKLEAASRSQARKEVLNHANLKMQWDKQGKHIEGHRNFDSKNKSIFTHSDPQKLACDFGGKGMRVGNKRPGTPGYKEIVDFGEFIGYTIHPDTGEKIATTWGKIHYAKDGIHIVPTKPRS